MALLLSSSYYKQKYLETQTQIDNEMNMAGVKRVNEDSTEVEFLSDRIKALISLRNDYENLYNQAVLIENQQTNPTTSWFLPRMETGN